MKFIWKLIILYISFLSIILTGCGGSESSQPESLIYSNVKSITLYGPADGDPITSADEFTYYIPGDVHVAVLGIFANEIETSGDTFVNADDLLAGSRTGLTGWTTGSVSAGQLYEFDGVDDFDPASTFNTPGTYHWAVWGFDKYGELTHASPQREVTINY